MKDPRGWRKRLSDRLFLAPLRLFKGFVGEKKDLICG